MAVCQIEQVDTVDESSRLPLIQFLLMIKLLRKLINLFFSDISAVHFLVLDHDVLVEELGTDALLVGQRLLLEQFLVSFTLSAGLLRNQASQGDLL